MLTVVVEIVQFGRAQQKSHWQLTIIVRCTFAVCTFVQLQQTYKKKSAREIVMNMGLLYARKFTHYICGKQPTITNNKANQQYELASLAYSFTGFHIIIIFLTSSSTDFFPYVSENYSCKK